MKNNFQKLEEETIQKYGEPPEEIKEKIDHTLGILSISVLIIDLFITKLIRTIVNLSKSGNQSTNDKEIE